MAYNTVQCDTTQYNKYFVQVVKFTCVAVHLSLEYNISSIAHSTWVFRTQFHTQMADVMDSIFIY